MFLSLHLMPDYFCIYDQEDHLLVICGAWFKLAGMAVVYPPSPGQMAIKGMWNQAMAQLCDRQLIGKTKQTVIRRQGEHKGRRLQGPKLGSKGYKKQKTEQEC